MLVTPRFRVMFPSVFEMNTFNENNPKYSLTMLFDEGTDLSKIEDEIEKTIIAKWGKKRPAGLKLPFRDAGEKEQYTGFESGMIFANATTTTKPGVVDSNLDPIMSKEYFYAGCYARASISVFAYNTKGNAGVGLGLNNIQKLAEGERIDGRTKAEEDFEPYINENQDDVFK